MLYMYRILTLTLLAFGFLMLASYTATLTSQLAIAVFKLPVNTFEDLADSDMGFAVESRSIFLDMLKYKILA